MEVSGTVTLKGKPLSDGTISFEPLDGQPTRATAMLTGGGFTIPKPFGLVPGRYMVEWHFRAVLVQPRAQPVQGHRWVSGRIGPWPFCCLGHRAFQG